MNRVIVELNELEPDLVVCTGDLTNEGYRQEYKIAVAYLDRVKAPLAVVPGNHDARNVGYLHFEELIGPRRWVINATVPMSYARPDPDAHLAELAADLGLAGPGTGLLTGVDVATVVTAPDAGVTVWAQGRKEFRADQTMKLLDLPSGRVAIYNSSGQRMLAGADVGTFKRILGGLASQTQRSADW